MSSNEVKYTYFGYNGLESKIPICIKLAESNFESSIKDFFISCGLLEINEKDIDSTLSSIINDQNGRIINVNIVSPVVAKQLYLYDRLDSIGNESISYGRGYNTYRFAKTSLMIFSNTHKEWTLGVFPTFGSEEFFCNSKIVLNRALTFALLPLGIIGFWGVPISEGVVVMSQLKSQGEAVFIDIFNNFIISQDEIKKIPVNFSIIKLDERLYKKNIIMDNSELIGFLDHFCTSFNGKGINGPIYFIILKIIEVCIGLKHPLESFKPRTSLSL